MGFFASQQFPQFLQRDQFPADGRLDVLRQFRVFRQQFHEGGGVLLQSGRQGGDEPAKAGVAQAGPGVGQPFPVFARFDPGAEQVFQPRTALDGARQANRALQVAFVLGSLQVGLQRGIAGLGFGRRGRLGQCLVLREMPPQSRIRVFRQGRGADPLGDPAQELGDVIQAGVAVQGQLALGGEAVRRALQLFVEHPAQRCRSLLGGGRIQRPGDQQALHEPLVISAVIPADAGIHFGPEEAEGRLRLLGRLVLDAERLAAQQILQGLGVQAIRHLVAACGFPQQGRAQQQIQVVAADAERPVVVGQRLFRIASVVELLRLGLVDVDQPGDVGDHVECLLRARQVVLRQEGFAQADVHLRRQLLAQADQPAAIGQLPVQVAGAAALAEAEEALIRGRHRHQLAQDGGAANARLGQGVLDGQELAFPVVGLLGDFGKQGVEIELVVPPGDALQDNALRPAEDAAQFRRQLLAEGALADHVDDAIDGHHEFVVVPGMLGDILQQGYRFVPAPGGLHQIRHQQQVVAVLGLLHQRSAIAFDGLLAEAAHGKDAGLELAGHGLRIDGPQFRQPALNLGEALIGLLGQIMGQHVQDEVLNVLHPVLRIDLLQLAQHLVVGGVVGQGAIDSGQLPQPLDFVAAAVLGVLVDHLRGRERVIHLGVDAHQQVDVVAVRLAPGQLFLQIDHDVRQGVQFRRQQQQLAFREGAPGRAVHAHPDPLPGLQRPALVAHQAVQPGEAHAFVVAQFAFGLADALIDRQCLLRAVQALVGIGHHPQVPGAWGQQGLQTRQDGQRPLVPAAGEAGLEQEHQPFDALALGRHVPLDHVHRLIDEAHLNHDLAGLRQQGAPLRVAGFQRLPDFQGQLRLGGVHVVGGEAGMPLHLVRFGGHQAAVFGDHVLGAAGRIVQVDQAAAGLGIDLGPLGRLIEGDGLVVALRLDQQIHPQPQQVFVGFRALAQLLDQALQGIVLAVGFHQHRQGIEQIGAHPGALIGGPCFALRPFKPVARGVPLRSLAQGAVAHRNGPFGQADMLLELAARGFVRPVKLHGLGRVAEQGQGHRGPVAERLIALPGQFQQGIDIALIHLNHGLAQADEFLFLGPFGGRRGPLVPGQGGLGISGGILQPRLEQQAVRGLVQRQGCIHGSLGLVETAVAPLQMGDGQVRVGPNPVRFPPVGGEGCQGPQRRFDALALQNRRLEQGVDALRIQPARTGGDAPGLVRGGHAWQGQGPGQQAGQKGRGQRTCTSGQRSRWGNPRAAAHLGQRR